MAFINSILSVYLWQLIVLAVIIGWWRASEAISRAPLLDLAVGALTWIPWVYSLCYWGWGGFLACLIGQYISLQTFAVVHQTARNYGGPTIRKSLDRYVGPASNHFGLLVTLPALPAFLALRVAEVVFYPMLVWSLGFPRYKSGDWINVSRQKFDGLVGHDLIWCLYCDWMTGVYSLGAEMLRNVESFWCPIRFYEGKKCENCRLDFPDIDVWVPADGTMKDVTEKLDEHYSPTSGTPRSWFGHPERSTKTPEE